MSLNNTIKPQKLCINTKGSSSPATRFAIEESETLTVGVCGCFSVAFPAHLLFDVLLPAHFLLPSSACDVAITEPDCSLVCGNNSMRGLALKFSENPQPLVILLLHRKLDVVT